MIRIVHDDDPADYREIPSFGSGSVGRRFERKPRPALPALPEPLAQTYATQNDETPEERPATTRVRRTFRED